jgi:TPR repeat protein
VKSASQSEHFWTKSPIGPPTVRNPLILLCTVHVIVFVTFSSGTVKSYLSRLDVKQIRRMAKTTKASPSVHRTRKDASEWLVKWANDQRSSKLLAAANSSIHSHSAGASKSHTVVTRRTVVDPFAHQLASCPRDFPTPMETPQPVSVAMDRIHRVQHQRLLTHMSSFLTQPAHALPSIMACSPASLFNAQIQCCAAAEKLEQFVALGHLDSRADLAWLLLDGREGVPRNCERAFDLVQHGASLGCPHCIGVCACCFWGGLGCEMNKIIALQLARSSVAGGSRYGFWCLGVMYRLGEGGVPRDQQQALQLFNMAAVLNLDAAQFMLGYAYFYGLGIKEDFSQALRWFNMSAAQGHPDSCYMVGRCLERTNMGGPGRASAIRWYERAHAAGHPESAVELYGQTCSS